MTLTFSLVVLLLTPVRLGRVAMNEALRHDWAPIGRMIHTR